jgi:hypothetical protein
MARAMVAFRALMGPRGQSALPSAVPAADRPSPWSGTVFRSGAHRPELAVALLARISSLG